MLRNISAQSGEDPDTLTNVYSSFTVIEKEEVSMIRQETEWGDVLWMAEDDEGILSIQGLQVGIISLLPGAEQPRHVHYDEQVIYVLQGQAISIIDGVESSLSAGDFFHWKEGVVHQVFNIGNVPFQHLLISNPVLKEADQAFPESDKCLYGEKVSSDLIYIATEAIRTQFLETLHYAYAIFDSLGNLILQSQFYPEYCIKCCQPSSNAGGCSCMRQLSHEELEEEKVYQCKYGMEVFHYPIYFRGTFLGYIQSGYILHSKGERGKLQSGVYDVPESVVSGVKALLKRIVKAIKNYCEFEQFRSDLIEKEVCIATHEEAQRLLMKNLQDTQYAMTDLKISNHFLFNTLNSMASMALDGGLMPLYQSIVDLSKMFHYTLRTQNSTVTLEKEVEYVKAYLQLQKLRYGDDLKVTYQIAKKALSVFVPFNFLQPIVENAFTHGFSETVKKRIKLVVAKREDTIEIKVINSGEKLSPQACYAVNQGILSNTSHGLSMVYYKLQAIYKDQCVFQIGSEKNGDTCFLIQIPAKKKDAGKEKE